MGVKHTYKNMESSYARVDVVTATNAREEMLANSDLHKKKKNIPIFQVDFHELSISAEKSLNVFFADMIA